VPSLIAHRLSLLPACPSRRAYRRAFRACATDLVGCVSAVRWEPRSRFRVVILSSAIKVGYRGIAKNRARVVFALFALANLYLVRGRW